MSELDGWWAEAYAPDVGWALGDGREHHEPGYDASEATALSALLEHQVSPEYYDRDLSRIPHRWLNRIRASMSRLTPQFSSNRMRREYVERLYVPAAEALNRRREKEAKLAADLETWHERLREGWSGIRFGGMPDSSCRSRCWSTRKTWNRSWSWWKSMPTPEGRRTTLAHRHASTGNHLRVGQWPSLSD